MKATKLFCLMWVVAVLGFTGPAFAESAAVTNYKQKVTRIVDTWDRSMSRFNEELGKVQADLAALNKQSPRPADYDKKAADLRTKITNLQASMTYASKSAEVDLGLLEFKPSSKTDKEEALPLPNFVKTIIAAKGIPLSKTVSVAPDASWNWKNDTLGTVGVKFNIKIKNL